MSEHHQVQQSKKTDSTFQKPAAPVSQTPVSYPYSIIQRAKINPKSLTHADIMQLQRTIGNRAVGRLLSEIGLIPSKSKHAPPVQMQTIPEDEKEPLQGKFESGSNKEICPPCTQKQQISEEEKPLQGKIVETIQRQGIPEKKEEPLQKKTENNTGMPDTLKAGVENLSRMDMSDVRVHYNSSKPAEVGALAYTQGTNIHVASGQEKHLPHEAWHVVQQAQGRVKPTIQLKDVAVNDDVGLEQEADVMGEKASLQYIGSVDEFPKIMEKENKRVQNQVMRDNTLVQFQINWDRVDTELVQNEPYKLSPFLYRSAEKERGDTEAKMLIEELRLRYRGEIPKNLLQILKNKLFSKERVTYVDIREAIKQAETELNLPQTENPEPAPQNGVERFVHDLKKHRGYYNWESGSHPVFISSLKSDNPGESELSKDATICCWEAVLFSAARTGLIAVDRIKQAYSDKFQLDAIEALITQSATTFKHYFDQNSDHAKKAPSRNNNIKVGDVIVIETFSITDGHEGEPDRLGHVVAAIKECREDYMKVEVMSLWNKLTGWSFNQVTLGDILNDHERNAVVKYSSLSQSHVEHAITQASSTPSTGRPEPPSSSIPSTFQAYIESTIAQSNPSPLTAPELPSSSGSSVAPEKSKCRCTLL